MAQNNLELMRTLDDSWNAQDWETFEKRHSKDTTVFWPGQAEPTRGRDNHKAESVEFFKTGEAAIKRCRGTERFLVLLA
jgi:hypothetical protein